MNTNSRPALTSRARRPVNSGVTPSARQLLAVSLALVALLWNATFAGADDSLLCQHADGEAHLIPGAALAGDATAPACHLIEGSSADAATDQEPSPRHACEDTEAEDAFAFESTAPGKARKAAAKDFPAVHPVSFGCFAIGAALAAPQELFPVLAGARPPKDAAVAAFARCIRLLR